ncbi:MAG: tRNA (adenosine(37)-N6)-threonylcarbamoyltransferase complex ATPase subunit type 1 TsaE [Sinomicrobium sp.]|nr:tRNA (adenosine(37)-N6)-threonylcarbamoyltransferase complex ATPase subunit type 1 TsaE [Sinomicrobium sp.]
MKSGSHRTEFESSSPQETIRIASKLARDIQPGTVLELQGGLGAGKTTFVKGIAVGLGLKEHDAVKSPTFVLMHIYPAPIPVYHFDLYRLDTNTDLDSIGLDEYLDDQNAVICVEWAEKARGRFPDSSIKVSFEVTGEKTRRISVQGT